MGFIEKAILINLFGDEWGGGEVWDAYELWKLWHYNKWLALVLGGVMLLVIGGILLGIHTIKKLKNNKALLWSGIVFASLGAILILIGFIYHMTH